jgi:hypothetical protein
VAKSSLVNLQSHNMIIDKALGISKNTSVAENIKAVDVLFDKSHPGHTQMHSDVQKAQSILDTEFKAPSAEVGWFYPTADIYNEGQDNLHDGQLDEHGNLNTGKYCPSTIPGHHLPHMWLRKGDCIVSTRDLLALNNFVLFRANPTAWKDVKSAMMDIVSIDNDDWEDVDSKWRQLSGVGDKGAVLVRPNGIVAWRSKSTEGNSAEEMAADLAKVLRLPSISEHYTTVYKMESTASLAAP